MTPACAEHRSQCVSHTLPPSHMTAYVQHSAAGCIWQRKGARTRHAQHHLQSCSWTMLETMWVTGEAWHASRLLASSCLAQQAETVNASRHKVGQGNHRWQPAATQAAHLQR